MIDKISKFFVLAILEILDFLFIFYLKPVGNSFQKMFATSSVSFSLFSWTSRFLRALYVDSSFQISMNKILFLFGPEFFSEGIYFLILRTFGGEKFKVFGVTCFPFLLDKTGICLTKTNFAWFLSIHFSASISRVFILKFR